MSRIMWLLLPMGRGNPGLPRQEELYRSAAMDVKRFVTRCGKGGRRNPDRRGPSSPRPSSPSLPPDRREKREKDKMRFSRVVSGLRRHFVGGSGEGGPAKPAAQV